MKKLMMIMAMVAVIGMAGAAEAIVHDFNGSGGTEWNSGTNWTPNSPAGLPYADGGVDLTVLTNKSTTTASWVEIGSGPTPGGSSLTVNTSGSLAFNAGLLFNRGHDVQVTHTSGAITAKNLHLGRGEIGGTTFRYDMDGGSLSSSDYTYMSDEDCPSVFDQTAGAVTLGDGGSSDYVALASSAPGNATWQISGGSFAHNGVGANFVVGGNSAPLDVGSTALFEIIGTGPSSVSTNGNVLVYPLGTMKFTMDASGVTPFTATGSVDVSLGNLAIDMGAFAGSGDILLIDSSNPITGPFSNAAEGAIYGGYTLTYLGGLDGNDVVLVKTVALIPEPAGLGLIGLALLAVRKRRS